MLDDNFVAHKEEKKEYPVLPKNLYQVELLAVDKEVKNVKPEYQKNGVATQEVLNFQFVVLDAAYRARSLWRGFVPTTLYTTKKNGDNFLIRITEALLKRKLTQSEYAEGLSGKFLNGLIGKQCKVFTDIKVVGDKSYSNIQDFLSTDVAMSGLTEDEKSQCVVKKKEQALEVNSEEIATPVDQIPF